jgi:uncharacterized protein (TIGR00251 family)
VSICESASDDHASPETDTSMSCTLKVKVVPGSSRDRVVGRLGDAIKIQVSAPPEGGKANAAVIEVVADHLGINARQITITHGHAQPRKILQIHGLEQAQLDQLLSDL